MDSRGKILSDKPNFVLQPPPYDSPSTVAVACFCSTGAAVVEFLSKVPTALCCSRCPFNLFCCRWLFDYSTKSKTFHTMRLSTAILSPLALPAYDRSMVTPGIVHMYVTLWCSCFDNICPWYSSFSLNNILFLR